MADPAAEYLAASDNADAFAQDRIEALRQQALEDIDGLFHDVDKRDPELWNELGVDPELTVDDYEQEDPDERNLIWLLGLAGLSGAASTQFFLDNRRRTIIEPVAYRAQALDGFQLTREQLVQAGKRAAKTAPLEGFKAIQARYLDDLAELSEAANVELYNALVDTGAVKNVDALITEHAGRTSRMVAYRPKTPQFAEATANLIDFGAGPSLASMNRRAVERIYSQRIIGGEQATLMVWIGEDDARSCAYCKANFGKIKTYRKWVDSGLPGEICAGCDNCRCHLEAA